MSRELINRISIKKDGVYVSTHSSNDNEPYHSVKIKSLTDIYNQKGQKGLDREIIDMMFDFIELRGSHHSLQKYLYAYNSKYADKLYKEYTDKVNYYYDKLSEEDKNSLWLSNKTKNAEVFLLHNNHLRNNMYDKIARKCEEYDLINSILAEKKDGKSFSYYENIIDKILEVSDDYYINFDDYCPFDSFGSDEEAKDLGIYSFSDYYKEILSKNGVVVEDITTKEKSAGKYLITINDKYNFDIKAWETLDIIVDNIDSMISTINVEKEMGYGYD